MHLMVCDEFVSTRYNTQNLSLRAIGDYSCGARIARHYRIWLLHPLKWTVATYLYCNKILKVEMLFIKKILVNWGLRNVSNICLTLATWGTSALPNIVQPSNYVYALLCPILPLKQEYSSAVCSCCWRHIKS